MRWLEGEADYDTYFGKEVWGERKNEKFERSGNNMIIIKSSDFYYLLFISLHNCLSRNITNLLIENNLLWENAA